MKIHFSGVNDSLYNRFETASKLCLLGTLWSVSRAPTVTDLGNRNVEDERG